jgi:hypothetical protein
MVKQSRTTLFVCLLSLPLPACASQVDRGCNVLEFHEKPPRTQLATMSIDTLEYGFGKRCTALNASLSAAVCRLTCILCVSRCLLCRVHVRWFFAAGCYALSGRDAFHA